MYFDGEVRVGDTLEQTLSDLFGDAPATGEDEGEPVEPGGTDEPDQPERTVTELLALAENAFADAQDALDQGDLGEYQAKIEEARGYVQEAQALEGGGTTTTTELTDAEREQQEADEDLGSG